MRAKMVTIILTCLGLKLALATGKDSKNYTRDSTNAPDRILFGQPVDGAQYPFLVALNIENNELCDGSIIADSWIMSAGHCMYGKDCANNVEILPAVWGRQRSLRAIGCQVHPQYAPNRYQYDISLIRVAENLQQLGGPQSICLPKPGTYYPGGTPATIAGYGKTQDGEYPNPLLAAQTQIEDWNMCNNDWHENIAGCPDCPASDLPNRVVCTKGGNSGPSGTCFGDSGGPVVVDGCVVGVSSFVQTYNDFCKYGAPSMHTSVVDYLPWIISIVQPGTDVSGIQVRPEN